MGAGEAHPVKAIYGPHRAQKVGEQRSRPAAGIRGPFEASLMDVGRAAGNSPQVGGEIPTVRVDVLAEEGHLAHTIGG